MLGITGTNSNKAHLINGGVLKEGATFTQFSEMVTTNLQDRVAVDIYLSIQNYDTLGGDTQSNRSTSTDSSPVSRIMMSELCTFFARNKSIIYIIECCKLINFKQLQELQPRITASGRVKAKSSKGSNSENPYFSNSN